MYYSPRRLLDQITLVHGPHDMLERFFRHADATARRCGVRLRLHSDFDRLLEVNERYRASWSPLTPIFHPAYSNLRIDGAFWIEGVDDGGETVLTNAGRLYDWHGTTLGDELRSLRVFFEDPAPHLAAGDFARVDAPSADRISGRVVFTGAMWVRPDYRRRGLTKIVPRITRLYAFTRWGNPLFWAFIEPDLHEIGVTRAYGPWQAEESVAVRLGAYRGDITFHLLTASCETMLEDAARLAGQATETSRRTEMASV